jgi:hypothetical protein
LIYNERVLADELPGRHFHLTCQREVERKKEIGREKEFFK